MGYALPDMPSAISDDSGHFQLSGIPVGKLQLQARSADDYCRSNPKEIMEVGNDAHSGSPTCVLKMAPTGIVRVQLVDAQGKPFVPARQGEANVHIQDADRAGLGSWGGVGAVDINGVCEFRDVPPGRYRLSDKPFIDKGQTEMNEIILTVKPRQINEVRLNR